MADKNISIFKMFKMRLYFYSVETRIKMNRIKEVLEARGIKQTWLAEKLGKSYNMVNSYVQNRSQPSLETLNQIAEILDIDVKELIVSNKEA